MSDDDHDHEHDDPHDHAHDEQQAERRARRRAALAQVRQYGDPVLRMRAGEVDEFDEELARLAERMIGLMHAADGVVLRRLFVFSDEGDDRVLVNPVLTKVSNRTEVDDEGCLSLGPVRMPVERPAEVTLDGVDQYGEAVHLELDDLSARVVQHELDHLDGKLIIDRTDPESRREAMAQLRPRLILSR